MHNIRVERTRDFLTASSGFGIIWAKESQVELALQKGTLPWVQHYMDWVLVREIRSC